MQRLSTRSVFGLLQWTTRFPSSMKGIPYGTGAPCPTSPHTRLERSSSPAWMKRSVALVLVALASCGPDERDVGTSAVYDSAGVTIIDNPGPDQPLGVTVTPMADLIPPDSALTVVSHGVTVDDVTGRIFVADRPNDRVVVFEPSGVYAGTLGRPGDGPGEFRDPDAVSMDPSGSLVVWDNRRRLLSRWSSGGDFLGEERPDLDYRGRGFAVGNDWLAVVTVTAAGMAFERQLVVNKEGNTTTLHEVTEEMAMMELRGGSFPAAKVFVHTIVWTNRGDSIFFLNGPDYRIDKSVGGALVLSFRRSVDAIEVTREMAVRKIEAGPGLYAGFMRQSGLEAEDIVTALGYEERIPPVMGVTAVPEGRFWVTRTQDGFTPGAVDVFDASGRYEDTFEAPGVPVAFVSDSTFVALRLEEFGETILTLQRLRMSQGSF